ncbi:MAG: ABC transporter ATP-binding protein [Caldilineales bacterium]
MSLVAPLLQVHAVTKTFAATPVLHGVSFEVAAGEIVCLLGPSGCGKTTLLRIVAGLEQADTGELHLGGQDLTAIPVHQRGFGFMFQDFALFPHRNVADNVAFGLRMAGTDKAAIQRRVAEMLALVGLSGYERRRVQELSGGQQQRVALARSLAPQPRLLLLDEPLGSLDRTLREELLDDLRAILKQAGITALYVTHDQQEAFAVADRVIVMNAGRIEQMGTPAAVYGQPASVFVARFLGMSNLLAGRVTAVSPQVQVATVLGVLHSAQAASSLQRGDAVQVLIRPDAARPAACTPDTPNCLATRLISASFRGSRLKAMLAVGDIPLTFELVGIEAARLPAPGAALTVLLAAEGVALLQAIT